MPPVVLSHGKVGIDKRYDWLYFSVIYSHIKIVMRDSMRMIMYLISKQSIPNRNPRNQIHLIRIRSPYKNRLYQQRTKTYQNSNEPAPQVNLYQTSSLEPTPGCDASPWTGDALGWFWRVRGFSFGEFVCMRYRGGCTFRPITWGKWLGWRYILLIGGGSLDSALDLYWLISLCIELVDDTPPCLFNSNISCTVALAW